MTDQATKQLRIFSASQERLREIAYRTRLTRAEIVEQLLARFGDQVTKPETTI